MVDRKGIHASKTIKVIELSFIARQMDFNCQSTALYYLPLSVRCVNQIQPVHVHKHAIKFEEKKMKLTGNKWTGDISLKVY